MTTMAPTRRTLVRGAAWTIPVVSVAATAPAYAASRFACTVTPCKTQNKQDSNRWDFKAYLSCNDGTATTVFFNGKTATQKWDAKGREYWVLARQPHSYTALLKVLDRNGVVGLERTVTFGGCPS